MNAHHSRSLQLSTAWMLAIALNVWAIGPSPQSIFAAKPGQQTEQQFFPTTDPRGYLTLVTLNGGDARPESPSDWNADANSSSIHTSKPNTSVTFLAKLPGQPTDWRLGVTGGSNNGPTRGAYPVMVTINELPVGMVTLDATGGLDTQWTSIGQLAGKVSVTLTWGEGTGELASTEPFNLTAVQFARPFRDPANAPLTGATTEQGNAPPAAGQPGSGGGASPSGGSGGGSPPINFPPTADPRTDPDLAPPNPPDRRNNPPTDPPPLPPEDPPPSNPPPTNPPPPTDPPPRTTPPPVVPTPGAILPLTLGGLALLHRRRPVR